MLVADRDAVPRELVSDPAVHVFEPEPSLSTALQAQCIRLLYPALLEAEGGVITSDVDMVPNEPPILPRSARADRSQPFRLLPQRVAAPR